MIQQFCQKVLNVDFPSQNHILLPSNSWPLCDQVINTANSGSRTFCPPAVLGNLAYFFSGYSVNDQVTVTYNLDTNAWATITVGATKPTARYGHISGIISNVLYVSHGYGIVAGANIQTTYALDLSANTWTDKNPSSKPSSRRYAAGVVYSGKLYMIGGYDGAAWLQDIYAYDPVGNSWATLTAPTYACSTPAAATHGSYIYLVCGGTYLKNYLLRYDPAGDSWTTLSPCPNKGAYFSLSATEDGILHLLGGYNSRDGQTLSTSAVNTRDTWWAYNIAQDRWYAKPQLGWTNEYAKGQLSNYFYWYYHSSVGYGKKLFIFNPYWAASGSYTLFTICIPDSTVKKYMVVEVERGV